MAGTSLLLLLDDIAAVLDDVSLMTKVAAKKTAGVLGDDLAVNAEQVVGVKADRELPVVWAVAKGSFLNKLILVPAALLAATIAPWAITPVLMLGGLFLCYEGFEKVAHKFLHSKEEDKQEHEKHIKALKNPKMDPVQYEKDKVKGAIRTDFILSTEIIVITLGIVADSTFAVQLAVMSTVAILITVGVYGLVAGIVKLDDAGLYLTQQGGAVRDWLGRSLLAFAPILMKTLAYVGTIAMFMVGGGILVHGFHDIGAGFSTFAKSLSDIAAIGPALAAITPLLLNIGFGMVAGAVVLALVSGISAVVGKFKTK
jgi:hypothetical protein